jgi:hypothetical protein
VSRLAAAASKAMVLVGGLIALIGFYFILWPFVICEGLDLSSMGYGVVAIYFGIGLLLIGIGSLLVWRFG